MRSTLSLPRPARPLPKLRPRPIPSDFPQSAGPGLGSPAKDATRGGWLLHIDGSCCQIEGRMQSDGQKRFVPLRAQDLQPVRALIASGLAVIGALERLSRLGRRTHRLTPVLGLRLDQDGAVLLREMVLIG